jgi:hypothetical protein
MSVLRFGIFVVALLLVASLAPAASAYAVPRNQQLIYAVEITQPFKMSAPWTGDLAITVNDEGIVSGQYRSNSIKPDPFNGRTINVTGGLSGDFIRISFGTTGRMSAKGTIADDKISGTFYDTNNKMYDFVAQRVTRE